MILSYDLTLIRTPKNRKDTASIGLSLVFLVIKITLKRFVEGFFVRLLVSLISIILIKEYSTWS